MAVRKWSSSLVSLALVGVVALLASAAAGAGSQSSKIGRIGPSLRLTANGRLLHPAGRLTEVGNFPTGGALTRDGRFYWSVDSGHGHDDVQVVDVAKGKVVQVLPLPGAYGGIVFAPDGRFAYVSGEPRGNIRPKGPTRADNGDAVHVFSVDAATGKGTERDPITLPPTAGGYAQTKEGAKLGWPEGLGVSPDGSKLLVALNQADTLAIVDLVGASHGVRLVRVGKFPYGVVAADDQTAYVSNELDGTVSVVDLVAGAVVANIGVGGARGDPEAHPEGMLVDPGRRLLYVAVTNRDVVAVINTETRALTGYTNVGREQGIGTAPLALAESPDGRRLYVANSGDDSVAVAALSSDAARLPRVIGRIPTAAYPSAVAVTPDGARVVWLAAKGLGAGPNRRYGVSWADSGAAPYGSYVPDKLLGYVGVLGQPTAAVLRQLTVVADRQVRPANWVLPPAATPVVGPTGGASQQIKHVFYVVRENRTYDQIFGSEPRGDGDPALEVVDDNGRPGPAGGVTPNAHALARQFPLLDHFYADSEVSTDGHVITSSVYAIDFAQKALHADYSGRGHVNNAGQFPETFPPNHSLFDEAVREGTGFANLGEYSWGLSNDRSTYSAVAAGQDFGYPTHFGCDGSYPMLQCSTDSGHPLQVGDPTTSRFDHFQQRFVSWLNGGVDRVPSFVYLTLPNDHTNGAAPGKPTPKALIADNDLGLGQIVQLISHSPIWSSSAIFVVEDDSQDGADHVDAHRMPAFVISPYARAGAVVHTRYDQYSVIRTIELMLGMQPVSLLDALATPMYGAFTTQPDLTPYRAITPTQPLDERNPVSLQVPVANFAMPGSTVLTPAGVDARDLALALPFSQVDLVPQELSDAVLWHSVYGWDSTPPPPGPGASFDERARAAIALDAHSEHRSVADALVHAGAPESDG